MLFLQLQKNCCVALLLPIGQGSSLVLQITKYVEREVLNQASLFHPHVVGFKEVFLTPNHLAIVLEYVAGGNVLQYILRKGSLTENEVSTPSVLLCDP